MISFGPVPSRRLGKSLGINNIIAPKTCSYACVYCQAGRTHIKSIKRDSFFEPEKIYRSVNEHISLLPSDNYPDYLTLVSNGEPTLDINLGRTIELLRRTGIPVAVITNASLLFSDTVREDLYRADWISLKVDAADDDLWKKINRPDRNLDFDRHMKSIVLFSAEYKGVLCTESMIIDGLNDFPDHFEKLAGIVKSINPEKAYLSVPTRPPSEKWIKPPDAEKLNAAWQIFSKRKIKTELLTGFEGTDTGSGGNIYEDILNITAVHPLREDSMLKLLEKNNADFGIVESLINQKLIRPVVYMDKRFFIREYHFSRNKSGDSNT
jgi:wyosine [tRNA(Phe)-imidazoG37] synthetase (radical SAM superfamily)